MDEGKGPLKAVVAALSREVAQRCYGCIHYASTLASPLPPVSPVETPTLYRNFIIYWSEVGDPAMRLYIWNKILLRNTLVKCWQIYRLQFLQNVFLHTAPFKKSLLNNNDLLFHSFKHGNIVFNSLPDRLIIPGSHTEVRTYRSDGLWVCVFASVCVCMCVCN